MQGNMTWILNNVNEAEMTKEIFHYSPLVPLIFLAGVDTNWATKVSCRDLKQGERIFGGGGAFQGH